MTCIKFVLIVAAAIFFAVACTTGESPNTTETIRANATPSANPAPQSTPTPVELAAARATYDAVCVRCHQQNGEGGTVELDEGSTLKVPSFKKGRPVTHSDERLARQIANGGDGMPAFKTRLTPEQIADLVRFVRREFQAGLVK